MRDTLVIGTKHLEQLKKLNDEQLGKLFVAIMAYQCGEEMPELDFVTDLVFGFLKEDIDAHNKKYDERCKRSSENGKKGGRPKKVVEENQEVSEENLENPQVFSENPENQEVLKKATLPYPTLNKNIKEKEITSPKRKAFEKPTVFEIAEYIREKGYHVDAEEFWNFYESKGWMVGKNKMTKWKACVATWEKKRQETKVIKPTAFDQFDQREYGDKELEEQWRKKWSAL